MTSILDKYKSKEDSSGASNSKKINILDKYKTRKEDVHPSEDEGFAKSSLRGALQIPLGYLKKYPASYLPDLVKLATEGASKEVLAQLQEEEPELKSGVAEEARQKGMEYFPTQDLLEKIIEEKTGIPLTPQTSLQKAVRLGSTAAGFRPGGAKEKVAASVIAPSVKSGLESAGLPEPISEITGLVASGAAPVPSLKKVTKPSGLKARQFEKVTKQKKISAGRHEKINKELEKDFKSILDPLLEKNKTYSKIKEDVGFKDQIQSLFSDVKNVASEMPDYVESQTLRRFMRDRFDSIKKKGLTSTESERTFKKEFSKYYKSLPKDDASVEQIIDQYRKNNQELGKYFEPGKSSSFNEGKRDALLEYNRALADVIENEFPDSEFSKLFQYSNKRWTEINDVEKIEKYLEDLFKDKINFSKAHQMLRKDKENIRRPFQRILGEEGFKDFEVLMNDLLSMQKPHSLLKKAEAAGFKDLAKLAGKFLIHPKMAKLAALSNYSKRALQMMLDKPQIAITWKSALYNLKKGKFKESESDFKELEKSIED